MPKEIRLNLQDLTITSFRTSTFVKEATMSFTEDGDDCSDPDTCVCDKK